MPARKKHHYIPQFYLRKFASSESGKTIGLYNHQKDVFIQSAPIRHQACESYLYGREDDVEQALGSLEYQASNIIHTMLTHLVPPPGDSNAYDWLKQFILFQNARTLKAGNSLNNALTAGFREMFKQEKDYDPAKQEELRVVHEDPVMVNMLYVDQYLPLLNFMSCKLFVNLTNLPFITSDNPVIKYNQWMEGRGLYLGATGLGVKGLQIFLPIHPRVMLCLYDSTVYRCGNKKSSIVKIERESEIRPFNVLQYLFSESQLFFNEHVSQQYLQSLCTNNNDKRAQSKAISYTVQGQRNPMLLNSFTDPHIGLTLPFMKILNKAERFVLPNSLPVRRHPSFDAIKIEMSDENE